MVSRKSRIWNLLAVSSLLASRHQALAIMLGVEKRDAMTMTMTMPEIGEMEELRIRQAEATPSPAAAATTAANTNGGGATGPDATTTASAGKSSDSASTTGAPASSSSGQSNLFCSAGSYLCPSSVGFGCCPQGLMCRPNDCYGFLTTGSNAANPSSQIGFSEPQPTAFSRSNPLFTAVPTTKKGLSGGAIGGIAGGAVGGIVLIAAIIFGLLWCKKNKKKSPHNPYPTPDPSMHHYYAGHSVNAPNAPVAATVAGAATTSSGTHRRDGSSQSQGSGTYSPTASVAGYYNTHSAKRAKPNHARTISQISADSRKQPGHQRQTSYGAVSAVSQMSPEMSPQNMSQISPQNMTPGSLGTPASATPGGATPSATFGTYAHPQFSRSSSNNDSIPSRAGAVSPLNLDTVPGSPGSVSSGSMNLQHVRTISSTTADYNPPVASWPAGYNPPVAREPVFEIEGSSPEHRPQPTPPPPPPPPGAETAPKQG